MLCLLAGEFMVNGQITQMVKKNNMWYQGPMLYYELFVVLHSQTLLYLAPCAIVVIFKKFYGIIVM